MSAWVQDTADGCLLRVKVHPGARKNAITAIIGDALKIALTAPPVDGRANESLIAFIAETLALPKARITLVAGTASRAKTLRITGKSAAETAAALDPAISA